MKVWKQLLLDPHASEYNIMNRIILIGWTALLAGSIWSPRSSFAQDVSSISKNSGTLSLPSELFAPDQGGRIKALSQQPQAAERLQESQPEKPPPAEPHPLPDQKLSAFEAFIQGKNSEKISTTITQFGYDLFQQPANSFAPAEVVPVGPDYLLGPGDEIRITLWGKVNAEYPSAIDREGKINLPQIGILHLSGLTFSEAKSFLETELSRYYKPSEVKMNVSMGRLRSIRIFVVGKAQRPGSYTLSSLSTLINALFAAGGPGKAGTMRDIQVRRNGKIMVHFDLYDFLLRGDKTHDIRLMPEDVIFIPTAGPLAGIAGDVRFPAIYELKGEMPLQDFIEMAGGLNEIAFKGRIQIDRIVENSQLITSESNLDEIKTKELKVRPGDFVKVFSVVQDKKFVRLSGAVQREGEYAASPGMKVKDLILMAGGLKDYAFLKEAEVTRITPTAEGPKTEKRMIGLEKALSDDPDDNILLQENDYLFVRAVPEWGMYKTVQILGEVRFPGTYTIRKGEKLSSLIVRAGGFTDKAYLEGASFTRASVQRLQQIQLDEAIDRLQRQIFTKSANATQTALTPEDALQQKSALEQRNALIEKMKTARAKGRVTLQLRHPNELTGSPSDLFLEEGDTLVVPERPQHVQVIGSVYTQTAFIYDPKTTVLGYLNEAGGMTDEAEESELYVLKVDGSAISQKVKKGFFGGGLLSSNLHPGDTVVVPEKIEQVSWLKEIKDVTQILFQIAATAGIVIRVF